MPTLSPSQIYALATRAGLSSSAATVATAVALAESGGKTDAIGDVGLEDGTWGPSVGLWQIRSVKAQSGTGGPRDATRLTDPSFNAQSMAQISGAGSNFQPWTTFNSGAYKQYIFKANDAATSDGGTGAVDPVGSVGETFSVLGKAFTSGWGADAEKIMFYGLGVAAAAGLVIVGAVHTVSPKEA